jgi:hypothetical protein
MATRKQKPTDTEPDIQLLTTTKCTSISGRGEVRYSIGILDDDIYVKLVGSSGGGQINNAWIPLADIHKLLDNQAGAGPFTSSIFNPIFTGISSNNCGFTLAVALKEKLVILQSGSRRKYIYNSPAAFLAKVDKLIAAKSSKPSSRRKAKAAT